MNILKRLLKRGGSRGGPDFDELLATHVSRMKGQFSPPPRMEQRWARLLSLEVRRFTTAAMREQRKAALQSKTHHRRTRQFDEVKVVVSVIPSLSSVGAMAHFPEGYTALLNALLNEPGFDSKRHDFAHWICCCQGEQAGLHLTFLPAQTVHRPIMVLAQDLMTDEEKSQMGIIG